MKTPTRNHGEILTNGDFTEVIEALELGDIQPEDENAQMIIDIFKGITSLLLWLQSGHTQLAKELLQMYDSASEHNIDISREAIYKLAERMTQN